MYLCLVQTFPRAAQFPWTALPSLLELLGDTQVLCAVYKLRDKDI